MFREDPLTIHIGHLLHHVDQLLVTIPHATARLSVELHPRMLQLVPIPALGHDVFQVGYVVKVALKRLLVSTNAGAVVQEQHLIKQTIVLEDGKQWQ